MDGSPAIIKVSDLRLTLASQAGPVDILRGLSFNIARGEAIGIVGPSGSGKSTLLMCLTGLETPSAGSIRLKDMEIAGAGEDALARFRRENIGIVFQSFHLIPTMTALENVAAPLELARVPDAHARARNVLSQVGLEPRFDHYPAQLSGGEQQRVALARAIVAGPAVLFADEPTGNLDGATGDQIIDLMFRLHREAETTLVLVTHDAALAARCNRVIHLRDGVIDRIEEMHGTDRLLQAASAADA